MNLYNVKKLYTKIKNTILLLILYSKSLNDKF